MMRARVVHAAAALVVACAFALVVSATRPSPGWAICDFVTVTGSADAGGTVSPGNVTACPPVQYSFTATPSSGWVIDHWSNASCNAQVSCAGTTSSDLKVTVSFRDIAAPSAPTGLTVASSSCTSVSLTWTAASDNGHIASYNIYQDGPYVGSTATTSYTFSG